MRLQQHPYHLLLLTGLALLLATFFVQRSETVDIHVHDTYYVLSQGYVYYLFALVVWLLWALYLAVRKFLYSTSLTWAHVIFTLVSVAFLLLLLTTGGDIFHPRPRRYIDASNWNSFNRYQRSMRWIGYVVIVLLLGQITFFINLVAGLPKRSR